MNWSEIQLVHFLHQLQVTGKHTMIYEVNAYLT